MEVFWIQTEDKTEQNHARDKPESNPDLVL